MESWTRSLPYSSLSGCSSSGNNSHSIIWKSLEQRSRCLLQRSHWEEARRQVQNFPSAMLQRGDSGCMLVVTGVALKGLSSQKHLRDFRPQAFSSSVSILDLDPKPLDSIPRQQRLDQKIVSCYLRTGGALPKGSLPLLPNIITAAEREDRTLLFQAV
ncbi:hypothetical protein GOODEAATRI_030653 [Goodea atripinnis]|uniref:Inositol-pentakisphosphate 2-kinase n=1 Tax=Goodea atripinnis TaxID=208336 RepID=A0ABV0NGJ4_9TELE